MPALTFTVPVLFSRVPEKKMFVAPSLLKIPALARVLFVLLPEKLLFPTGWR